MPATPDTHDARVLRFPTNLKALPPGEVIRKYITTGMPVALTEEEYFTLRNTIADEFQLHPSGVIVVGSCRTGFSVAPEQRYREARPGSDLDVAIVSLERFDRYWDDVFAYSEANDAWKTSREYGRFITTLFNGWIDPRWLPNVKQFEQAFRWRNFFDRLMKSRQFGRRRITARLYRTWSRLEAYQGIAVRQCLANLGVQKNA